MLLLRMSYGLAVLSGDAGSQPKQRTAKRAAGAVVEGMRTWSSRQSVVTGVSRVMILRV